MPDPPPAVDYSIVLPAYREEENLRLLLPRIRAALAETEGRAEILVVDTVTPLDATELVCEEFDVRYLRRSPSNAFGDAVRVGIQEARGQWVLFMDADGSHGPEWIPRLIAERESHDVVIASRYVAGGSTENNLLLILMSMILNLTYSLVLGLKVRDVSNSYKLYRAAFLKELKLKCKNFDIIEEILFRIRRRHPQVRIKEIPFTFKTRMFGRTKRNLLWFVLTYLYTIVRLRFLSR
jgi:dolichol-phosphate mannosyltransferase